MPSVSNRKTNSDQIRKLSTFNKKLKYKEPEILNSSITIDRQTKKRMINEIIVIKDFIIVQMQENFYISILFIELKIGLLKM